MGNGRWGMEMGDGGWGMGMADGDGEWGWRMGMGMGDRVMFCTVSQLMIPALTTSIDHSFIVMKGMCRVKTQ